MTDKPRNKWFRGDKTSMEFGDNEIAVSRGCCSHNVGQKGFIREAPNKAIWSNQWEYAIVPLDDLKLDIEEPEPELVKVEGCQAPCILASHLCSSVARSEKGPLLAVFVRHPNKNVAIEAHNAAAEVLNKHGGV